MESAGQAATTLKAGESVKNDVGVVHNVTNSSTKTVKILAVYLVEKGKPLAEPVP
jgi:quercetin dioxygenase-like cupin family protein